MILKVKEEGSWQKTQTFQAEHVKHTRPFFFSEGDPEATAAYLHKQTTNYTIV